MAWKDTRTTSAADGGDGSFERAVERLVQATAGLAEHPTLREALQAIAEASAAATGSELAVIRVLDAAGQLGAAAVASASPARAAEVEGTGFPVSELSGDVVDDAARLPAAVRRIADGTRADAVLQLPVSVGDGPVATLELVRAAGRFDEAELMLARLGASQVALCLRAFPGEDPLTARSTVDPIELAGRALAAGATDEPQPQRLAQLAADAWGATAAVLWRADPDGALVPLGACGLAPKDTGEALRQLAAEALVPGESLAVVHDSDRLPRGLAVSAVVALGRPPIGALQLLFTPERAPEEGRLERLVAFGAHASHILRAGERARELSLELERTRALLAVLGQAVAELSLAHTLTTALDRIGSLLAVDRLAVYLKEGEGLVAAADIGLEGPHPRVAARLLELALGPARARGPVVVADAATDRRLVTVRSAVDEVGVEAALAVPLVAHEDVIGLLAAYPASGWIPEEPELALLEALAGHLAVAVQNAQLHEQAKELGAELEHALTAERAAGRRLRALYEVSRSFAQSLSLETTLEAVTRAAVESLDVDAAVLRVPDERGEALVTQTLDVADPRLADALRELLSHEQVISRPALQELFERRQPLRLDRPRALELGGSFALLVPFLEKGSTAVVIPLATPAETIGTLTLISLDPADPISPETAEVALSLARQAALAVENARLYEQQKQFADTMQRSLLPTNYPRVPGIELGVSYESSARMDVGGDIYDSMRLEDGRLAVVLGDVTGHGIDAAADMAMAKFVFRSLSREHPGPADFLAHANEVVAGEIAVGKFITLLYLTVDPAAWEVACAVAGHPAPRLVAPDGTVSEIAARGLALGIEPRQRYAEERVALPSGAAVVLYTDGVVESRRGRELYGVERLDAFVAANRELPAQSLAEALVEDCRQFGGGDLADDCAVVVLARQGG